ncbi:TPA: hypothetical protein SIA35_003699 [Aeromonas sobria]|nr:hypothetical protein [Aeromonas sobria]
MPFRNAEVVITDSTSETTNKPYSERIKGANEYIELTNAGQSTEYMQELADALDLGFNGPQFKTEIMGEEPIYRFHPAGTAPTPIIVPTLANRTVAIKMNDPYTNNPKPAKLSIKQGETVVSKTCKDAMLFSMAISRHDFEVDGELTSLTLQQEVERIAEQMDDAIVNSILNLMLKDPDNAAYLSITSSTATSLTGDVVEDMLEECVKKGSILGKSMEDFCFGLSSEAYQALARIARRSGFTSPTDYMGTKVFTFGPAFTVPESTNLVHVVAAPKRHVAISWREQPATGEVFDFIVSRNGATQSTTLEIRGIADLLIAGQTKAVVIDEETGAMSNIDVNLPLIQLVTVTTDSPSSRR